MKYTEAQIKGIDKLLRTIDLNAYLDHKGYRIVKKDE